jgi:hypothetical protein
MATYDLASLDPDPRTPRPADRKGDKGRVLVCLLVLLMFLTYRTRTYVLYLCNLSIREHLGSAPILISIRIESSYALLYICDQQTRQKGEKPV